MSFPETEWIWKNGKLIPWKDAQIHVMSHVVQFGSSVFEGIRTYQTPKGPAIFRLQEHLRRLEDSCRIYGMETPYSRQEMTEACVDIILKNGLGSSYIRPTILRGYGTPGISPLHSPVESYVAAWQWEAYLGKDAETKGVDVCVSSWNRPAPNTSPSGVKAGGHYCNSQLIKMEAIAHGYSEAIALGPSGVVSEGSAQNLFLVRDGQLLTPQTDGTSLSGITRDTVLKLAEDLGIPVREQTIPRELLYAADEAFFVGTASEVTLIRSIDRISMRGGEIARKFQKHYQDYVQGAVEDTHGWLTLCESPRLVNSV
jgi:branched-chain amino acid aminotransferase